MKMADNDENDTCGDMLVMTYFKTDKDELNLKENSPLWRVFCALGPCGESGVIRGPTHTHKKEKDTNCIAREP